MKRRLLTVPILIIVFIIVGVGGVAAALLIGTTQQGETNSQSVNLQKGLVGWWKMDGNAKDASSYRNHGTGTAVTLTNDRKGEAQKAYLFNGTTSAITLPESSSTPFDFTTAISISAWVKPASLNQGRILTKKRGSPNWDGYVLELKTTGEPQMRFGYSTADQTVTSSTSLVVNTWSHVVVTYNGSVMKIYIDGVEKGSTSTTSTIAANNQAIGIGGVTGLDFFNGEIDDLRLYNRGLSAAEVTALHQSYGVGIQISDLQKGLVGQWKMDGNAKDATPNRNHGTVTGAVLANDRKGQAQKAYGFDGGTNNINLGVTNDSVFSGDFSVSLWFKDPAVQTGWVRYLVYKRDSGSDVDAFSVGIVGDSNVGQEGKIQVRHNSGNSLGYSTGTFTDNNWHHAVVTRNDSGNEVKLYVDNVLRGSFGDITYTTGGIFMFGNNTTLARGLNGQIDDVRIYNRALSTTEITALYESYSPGVVVSDLQKGLVGHWSLDGNAKDRTPYRSHGTVVGAVLANDQKGQAQKAYGFNGVGDYITLGDQGNLDFGTGNFSIAAWVKYASYDPGGWEDEVVYKADLNNPRHGYLLGIRGSLDATNKNKSFFWMGLGDASGIHLYGSTVNDGTWHHIVGTANRAGNMILYKDGVYENQTSISAYSAQNESNTVPFNIGGKSTDSGFSINGSIGDVRMYNRVLSAAEVLALYESY